MSSKIWSAALNGLKSYLISVEAASGGGDFGAIKIIGLPDAILSESRERIRSSLRQSGLPYPKRKITVNLGPADIKKSGSFYDLPIIISILALQNHFLFDFSDRLLDGELSLSGEIKPLRAITPFILAAKKYGLKKAIIPLENISEASLLDFPVIPVKNLTQLLEILYKKQIPPSWRKKEIIPKGTSVSLQIKGQNKAKRALEISAAGGHHLLFSGRPGIGKTALINFLPQLLPEPEKKEKEDILNIAAIAKINNLEYPLINKRPFRRPPSNISPGVLSGSSRSLFAELSLAKHGLLFLDELPNFSSATLACLYQALDEGYYNSLQQKSYERLAADFILAAAMNPCPCGLFEEKPGLCCCSQEQIRHYRRHLSQAFLERFDLQIKLTSSEKEATNNNDYQINKEKIISARKKQEKRFGAKKHNASLNTEELLRYLKIEQKANSLAEKAFKKWRLSPRSQQKVLKISQTIADLRDAAEIQENDIAEALQYRQFDL